MAKSQIVTAILFLAHQASASRSRRQFQHFFEDVRPWIEAAIAANCTSQKADYLASRIELYGPQCPLLYTCIIDNIPSYVKDNMTSAAVLLGLTPFILASLGSNTTELALIAMKRPLLATLLVLGSPSVNPIRTFDYPKLAEDLEESENKVRLVEIVDRGRPHSTRNILRVIIEYTLVGASVANLMLLSWQLTLYTIAVTSCDSDILVQLWIGCAIFTHIFGILTFLTGSRRTYDPPHVDRGFWTRFGDIFRWETSPCATHPKFTLTRRRQNRWFVLCSWLASTYTLTHIGFGVTVLSSLAFVGSRDAGAILGRFGASAIVCRAIATYELAGMRAANRE